MTKTTAQSGRDRGSHDGPAMPAPSWPLPRPLEAADSFRDRVIRLRRRRQPSLSEPRFVREQSLRGWRRQDVHIDHFKPEAGDPLQQPGEGPLIGQLGAENRSTATYSDFAVVEFRAQRAARLSRERDLVCL